ncbi:MAG: cell division protein MukB, partial [Lachnospiraceae bacterium]|nr:cell division protein MukB [Lachnospiraceae bacterium]
ENRYAAAYIQYVLGRVIRCENVQELEEYKISITPECMLYQGYVVRHLNPKDYRDPYIGIEAFRVQLANVKAELEGLSSERKKLREETEKYAEVLKAGDQVNVELLRRDMGAPTQISELKKEMGRVKAELKEAEKDPTLIELGIKLKEKEVALAEIKEEQKREIAEQEKLKNQVEGAEGKITEDDKKLREQRRELDVIFEQNGADYSNAEEKYKQNRKTKEPGQIYANFHPQKARFENEKKGYVERLYDLQGRFNADFSLDFTMGTAEARQYREAKDKLAKVEIVKYEEKLRTAKADCERIFRSDFLSRMKEHIENARQEFRNLNKALENVYYGDDSYHFNLTYDKRKESLYRMITSEYNMEGENNLWTNAFEAEYKDEIEDLFAKLMVRDDKGEKVIEEYTDYRSYLDYDIEIRKRDGKTQKFSDIYGEKSGSETQVPYYVAIAASFYQLYRYGNSVRLMLLDEAFDKMDDDRIKSMLEFMNDLKLQVIMATPPQKIEIIGEQVDCILTAIRDGNRSIVEEYEL